LLLTFAFYSAVTAQVIFDYDGGGFNANVYYQIGNLSTTAFNPLNAGWGTPGTDWRVSCWNHSQLDYDRFGEGGDQPDLMAQGFGHWIIFAEDRQSITFPGETAYNEISVPLNLSPDGNTPAYTMLANPWNAGQQFAYVGIYANGQVRTTLRSIVGNWINSNLAQWRGEDQQPDYSDDIFIDQGNDGAVPGGQAVWITNYMTEADAQQWYGTTDIFLHWDAFGFNHEDVGEPVRDEPVTGWDLQLAVSSSDGEHLYEKNWLGVRENAADVFDCNDFNFITPPIDSYIRAYFPHLEYDHASDNYIRDFRSMEFDGPKEWEFTIKTVNVENNSFTLDWAGMDDIPENYTLTLTDVDNNRVIGDMRDIGQVSFRNGDGVVQEFHYRVTCDYTPEWIGPGSSSLPGGFGLTKAYPNPFNNVVNLEYRLPMNQNASLKVFDMTGKLVDVINGNLQGAGTVSWNANGMQSGVYMMKLISGDQVSLKKVILMQ